MKASLGYIVSLCLKQSKSAFSSKTSILFIVCVCVYEYEHTEAMTPEDLNSVHRACTMNSFISRSQLSSLQVISKGKNNVFDLKAKREY